MQKIKLNKDLLKEVMLVQSHSRNSSVMSNYIFDKLSSMNLNPTFDDYGNIYVVKGESDYYPTAVCHIDTVHKIIPQEYYKVHTQGDIMYAFSNDPKSIGQVGIGGDI